VYPGVGPSADVSGKAPGTRVGVEEGTGREQQWGRFDGEEKGLHMGEGEIVWTKGKKQGGLMGDSRDLKKTSKRGPRQEQRGSKSGGVRILPTQRMEWRGRIVCATKVERGARKENHRRGGGHGKNTAVHLARKGGPFPGGEK